MINAFVVRPGKTRYGPRKHWKEIEYAQAAIGLICEGALPPPNVDHSKLTRHVNRVLQDDPEYRASCIGEIDRMTVIRALERYKTANR